MHAAVERDAARQVLHSCGFPGAAVCGDAGFSQALALWEETTRFVRCFPWLNRMPSQICVVTERVYSTFSPEWETGTALLSADLDRTPEEVSQQCRLLLESAVLLQRCLDSFPDPAYDYRTDTEHPAWLPGSGLQLRQRYIEQMQVQLGAWGMTLTEEDWIGGLQRVLEALQKRADFMHNHLFRAAEGFCCAGYWLRVQTERCHLTGRRLYELGVSAFGRRSIADTLHFYE